MKNKNPLYVVKGKEVQEVKSLFEMVIKKFNLEPAFNILKSLFMMLLEQVENFAMFQAVKGMIDEIIQRMREFSVRIGLLPV